MRTLAALSLAALAAVCRLTNDTVMVAALVQAPTAPAALGLPSASVAVAQVYLGQTSVTNPSAADMTPISAATVQLLRDGVAIATLNQGSQPGYYQATGDFYQAASTFRFVARVGSDEYWGEVANVPGPPVMTLPGSSTGGVYTYPSYGANVPSPYSIGRGACAITTPSCNIGFYGVWTVSGTTFDGSAPPNCTNAPQTAGDLLDLAFFDDTPWRVNPFQAVKAACFPSTGAGTYVVGLTDLQKGTVSGNLSVASMALAGASTGAGVIVSGP